MQPAQIAQDSFQQLSNGYVNKNSNANKVRLDKFICNNVHDITRSKVKEYIKKGLVKVNNTVVKVADIKIDPEVNEISFNNQVISFKKHIYLMLNKPQGVVCSTRDGLSPTVLSLIPDSLMRKGLFPAGRLDKDTEGFVLITDDGELAHRMLSPRSHVGKVYYVELGKDIDDEYIDKFEAGIVLNTGEKCLPSQIEICKDNRRNCHVILYEGMYHQVKKMFESLGNKVVYLKRVQIGALHLDEKLKLGECKEIVHKNVEKLLEKCDFKEKKC